MVLNSRISPEETEKLAEQLKHIALAGKKKKDAKTKKCNLTDLQNWVTQGIAQGKTYSEMDLETSKKDRSEYYKQVGSDLFKYMNLVVQETDIPEEVHKENVFSFMQEYGEKLYDRAILIIKEIEQNWNSADKAVEQNVTSTYRAIVVLKGRLTADNKLKDIVNHLEEAYNLPAVSTPLIKSSELRITLGGSFRNLKNLQELFRKEKLKDILHIPIEDIKILSNGSSDDKRDKHNLVQEINKKKLGERQLVSANLSEMNLVGCFLVSSNLSAANLSRADLTVAKLVEAELFRADLYRADLYQTKLSYADLRQADLREANLEEADMSQADLQEANLHKAWLVRAVVFRADLRAADLQEANLTEADMSQADLRQANLHGARLVKAVVFRANLCGADLSEADLSKAIWWQHALIDETTKLSDWLRQLWESLTQKKDIDPSSGTGGTNCSGSDVSKANLSDNDITDANFSYVNSSGTNFSRTKFTNVDFSRANCNGADFSRAIFSNVNFRGTDLRHVGNVQYARFISCKGLSKNTRRYLKQQGAIFEVNPARRIVGRVFGTSGNSSRWIASQVWQVLQIIPILVVLFTLGFIVYQHQESIGSKIGDLWNSVQSSFLHYFWPSTDKDKEKSLLRFVVAGLLAMTFGGAYIAQRQPRK